jgi:hypothetical protein
MALLRQRGGVAAAERSFAARAALARTIMAIAGAVAAILTFGILLKVLHANGGNVIVGAVNDAARALAGPFHDLFRMHGAWRYVVNWGIAALVYVLVGRLVARLLVR